MVRLLAFTVGQEDRTEASFSRFRQSMLAFLEEGWWMQTILRVFKYIRRYPWLATGTVGFAVLATLMVIVFPTVTQRVIDDAIRGRKPELIPPLALLAVGAFLVQSLAKGFRMV